MGDDQKFKAVIWDMGGVLLRSENYDRRELLADRFKMSEHELEHLIFNSESAELATIGKITQIEHWRNTALRLGLKADEAIRLEEDFWDGDRCDKELVKFIRTLRPGYRTGLLSNAWMGTRETLGDKYGCLDAFDVAVFSYEVGMAKPDPRIYAFILEKLGIQPDQAIFVDDFLINVQAARELGIAGIHFQNRNQAIREVTELIS